MAEKPALYLRLTHIAQAIQDIFRFTEEMDEADFLADYRTQLAVVKLFEIVGEAAYHVDHAYRQAHPEVPWKSMAGMRHVLVHDYYRIDPAILWNTKEVLLPDVKSKIDQLLTDFAE